MTENCPECNGAYNNGNSSKRVCFDHRRPAAKDHRGFDNQRVSVHERLGGKASVHDQLGGKASVHDRLGDRANEDSNDQLEEMVDSLVPDENIMCRAPERRRTLQLDDERSSQTHKKTNQQWCPDGLTKSRKRSSVPTSARTAWRSRETYAGQEKGLVQSLAPKA
jgi:hypothetical protein